MLGGAATNPNFGASFTGVNFMNGNPIQMSAGSGVISKITGTPYATAGTPYFDIVADGYIPGSSTNTNLRIYTNNLTSGVYGNIILGYNGSNAAGKVVIGAANPATSASLDISSTTTGFLKPRMTTTQKNAIASPAEVHFVGPDDAGDLAGSAVQAATGNQGCAG